MNARQSFDAMFGDTNQAMDNLMRAGQAVINATLWPWIIAIDYTDAQGLPKRTIEVEQRTLADTPQPEDLMPAGGTFLRAELFPATRFDDLPPTHRWKYKDHYAAYLKWRLAHALGKKVEDLIPWEEMDPISIDMKVQRWASVGSVWQGD